jgi:hypothetical protein
MTVAQYKSLNESLKAAGDRLWEENQRLRRELLEAEQKISKLTKTPLGANAVIAAKLDVPGKGRQPIVIGIVECPKCGQLMEVEK